ncbi:MAG: hypothetical protein L0H63_11745 [Nitrococcus sp.]|nr:hypothetical protein [Nitrococcus sp.]
MTTTYIIEAGDLIMGEYQGETPEQALDAYARDGGYADYAILVATVGGEAIARKKDDEATL